MHRHIQRLYNLEITDCKTDLNGQYSDQNSVADVDAQCDVVNSTKTAEKEESKPKRLRKLPKKLEDYICD